MKDSFDIYNKITKHFQKINLFRPINVSRYEPGITLCYNMKSLLSNSEGRVTLKIEKFIGGGFAGQVYKVKVIDLDNPIEGLNIGESYAVKILLPPGKFSLFFRNLIYFIGFQSYFQLQVNSYASKAGALWQKLIRRGAKIKFGDENLVVDIYATFIDSTIGSCGEISQWIEGRTWKLETDSFLNLLSKWKKDNSFTSPNLGSPEYRQKFKFMHDFVNLLHEMGAHEFARQYEWSTCKSQPNALKRVETENDPNTGLTAVDFRAGLALLPFLPMSPGDFKLILKGLKRGSIVQFDRGNLGLLENFINKYKNEFFDLLPLLEELKTSEEIYRTSIIDITHNHLRLLYSIGLWKNIFSNTLNGWHVRNVVDKKTFDDFSKRKFKIIPFSLLGLIPILGTLIRKIWAREDYRKHYFSILTKKKYFTSALRGRILEITLSWYRVDRISSSTVSKIIDNHNIFFIYLPFCFMPPTIHRMLTDVNFAKLCIGYIVIRPVKLYFNKNMREDWLRKMVASGQKERLVTDEDAGTILSQIEEPFIQKYLKSLAVHLCTAPITQLVSVAVATIYIIMNPDLPRAQALGIGLGIIAIFQITPISPGSLARGLYVLYLVIKERNFKDYNLAVFLGFFKYVGYLAFPIQMANRYPTLARFMAAHWATQIVHIVPVFGEKGALLEHGIFSLFYNYPLTLKRKIMEREVIRKTLTPRFFHIPVIVLLGAAILLLAEIFLNPDSSSLLSLKNFWPITILIPSILGASLSLFSRGVKLSRVILYSVFTGIFISILSVTPLLIFNNDISASNFLISIMWRIFIFTILTTISSMITEIKTL